MRLSPDVLVITGDHSTPSLMSGHSWHPVPFLLKSDYARRGDSASFGESQCRVGAGGRIDGRKLIGLMLAHARRLEKFGA